MSGLQRSAGFDAAVLPHLDAAYNLARWISGNEHDAQDIVQEAMVRALRGFVTFRGGDARAWILTVVRNTALTRMRLGNNRRTEELGDHVAASESAAPDPQTVLMRAADAQRVRQAIAELPVEHREIIILREMEQMSYRQIADITAIPMGTVMSRLSRARRLLAESLGAESATAARENTI